MKRMWIVILAVAIGVLSMATTVGACGTNSVPCYDGTSAPGGGK